MKHVYYIGLQLPDDIDRQIEEIQQELFDPALVMPPLEPHITLLPPPALEHIPPSQLAVQAKPAAEAFWPLRITLTEAMTFDSRAVAIHAESPNIHKLQETLKQLLPPDTQITYYPNPQFTPHVTLAQAIRGKKLPAELVGKYKEKVAGILPATFDSTQLTLFQWKAPRQYEAKPL